jgi:rod shape-determining protein MreC
MLRSLSGTTRLILLLFALLLSILFVIPKQSHDLLDHVGRPIAYIVSLPLNAIASLDRSLTDAWQSYVDLRWVHEENRQLRREILLLRGENSELRETAAAVERLTALLDFKQSAPTRTVAAQVIARDASNLYRGVILNKGERDGLRPEMGVMTPIGVVGRVIKTGPTTAVVLLLTDPHNAIAGIIQRNRDEGIVEGTATGGARIKYLPLLSSVRVGDTVVTSGLAGGFPRGLVIGSISSLEREEGALFQSAAVTVSAELSKLEEVLVITEPHSGAGGVDAKEKRP